jgi:steroid delta-isomerase-like uncharacterized protein
MRAYLIAIALLAFVAVRVEAEDTGSAKDILLGFYQNVFNDHNLEAIDNFMVEDFVDHNPDPGQKPGREGVKEFFVQLIAAFPDLKITNEQVLTDGDIFTVRSTLEGTQQGEFLGMPASGKSFKVTVIDIVEVKDGKATQRWGVIDAASMMAQLGAGH